MIWNHGEMVYLVFIHKVPEEYTGKLWPIVDYYVSGKTECSKNDS